MDEKSNRNSPSGRNDPSACRSTGFRLVFSWGLVLALALLTPMLDGEDKDKNKSLVENPKFESWHQYRTGTTIVRESITHRNQKLISHVRETVVLQKKSKHEVNLTIDRIVLVNGQEVAAGSQSETIKKMIPKISTIRIGKLAKDKRLEESEGEESIKIDRRRYRCKWSRTNYEFAQSRSTKTTWECKLIPGLIVKQLMESSDGSKVSTKLVHFKKK